MENVEIVATRICRNCGTTFDKEGYIVDKAVTGTKGEICKHVGSIYAVKEEGNHIHQNKRHKGAHPFVYQISGDPMAQRLYHLYNGNVKIDLKGVMNTDSTFLKFIDDNVWWDGNTKVLFERTDFFLQQFEAIEAGMETNSAGRIYRLFGRGGEGKSLTGLKLIYDLGKIRVPLLYVCIRKEVEPVREVAYLLIKETDEIIYGEVCLYGSNEFYDMANSLPDNTWVIVDSAKASHALLATKNFKSRSLLQIVSGREAYQEASNSSIDLFKPTDPVPTLTSEEFLQFGYECANTALRKLLLANLGIAKKDEDEMIWDPFSKKLDQNQIAVISARLLHMWTVLGGNARYLLRVGSGGSGFDYACEVVELALANATALVFPKPLETKPPTNSCITRANTRAIRQWKQYDMLKEIHFACTEFIYNKLSCITNLPANTEVTPSVLSSEIKAGTTSLLFTVRYSASSLSRKLRKYYSSFFLRTVCQEIELRRSNMMIEKLKMLVGSSGIGYLHEYHSLQQFLVALKDGTKLQSTVLQGTAQWPTFRNLSLMVISFYHMNDLKFVGAGMYAISTNPQFPFIDGCVVIEKDEVDEGNAADEASEGDAPRIFMLLQSTISHRHYGAGDRLEEIKANLGVRAEVDQLWLVYLLDDSNYENFGPDKVDNINIVKINCGDKPVMEVC